MPKLLLTCEHGGNYIPAAYEAYFKGKENLLSSHEGYDVGAFDLFRTMAEVADVSFYSEASRLLVELNRSLHHPRLFSQVTRQLPAKEKQHLMTSIYLPYRNRVEEMVQDLVSAGLQIIHISVHSFTPVLQGETRHTDIGLLYDPKRPLEQTFCRSWKAALLQEDPQLKVRFNYPYLGIADGFPTYLRRKFTDWQYAGIELEVNQQFPLGDQQVWAKLKQTLKATLSEAIKATMTDADQDL